MKTLFGIWFSLSLLLNAFAVWLSRVWNWNESNSLWAPGFPLLIFVTVGCVMTGAIKGRSYLLVLGMTAYTLLWVFLMVDKWKVPILVVSMINLVLIGFIAVKMGYFKVETRPMTNQ